MCLQHTTSTHPSYDSSSTSHFLNEPTQSKTKLLQNAFHLLESQQWCRFGIWTDISSSQSLLIRSHTCVEHNLPLCKHIAWSSFLVTGNSSWWLFIFSSQSKRSRWAFKRFYPKLLKFCEVVYLQRRVLSSLFLKYWGLSSLIRNFCHIFGCLFLFALCLIWGFR